MGIKLTDRFEIGLPDLGSDKLRVIWLGEPEGDHFTTRPLVIGFNFHKGQPSLFQNLQYDELEPGIGYTEPEEVGYTKQLDDRVMFHYTADLDENAEQKIPAELTGLLLPRFHVDDEMRTAIPAERLQSEHSPPDAPDEGEMVCPYCDAVNNEGAMYCVECREIIDRRVRKYE